MTERVTNTLIVGASAAGLACAATLAKQNIPYIIIEKEDRIASSWHRHYERLHLHTSKSLSNLPYKVFGKNIPTYPSRQQVIDYLEDYKKEFNIEVAFGTEVNAIKYERNYWIAETNNGVFKAKYLIMATGAFGKPKPVHFRGMESFRGRILHSAAYKTGKDFKGQKVLVVGFGNSACEIAIDLYEQGAAPCMSVRSPVNVIPRDVLGLPVLRLSLWMKRLPPRIADKLSAPLINLLIGDIAELGLKKMPYGPLEQIAKDGKAPVLDIGAIQLIRRKHIKIFGGIDHIKGNTVYFKDHRKETFDAIIAAIGYKSNDAAILQVDKSRFDDLRFSIDKQQYFGKDGLYFCGYWISPTGHIREIALDAMKIAKDIAGRHKATQ